MVIELGNRAMKKLFVLLLSCMSMPYALASDTGNRLGFAFVTHQPGHSYLYTTLTSIDPGQVVDMQFKGAGDEATCCAHLNGSALGKPQPATETVSDEEGGLPVFRYEVAQGALRGTGAKVFVGIAVVHAADESVAADAKGWNIRIGQTTVKSCTSAEGLHLFANHGNQAVAHMYFGLDYGVKPTCDPKLFPAE
jgi:hypothetical protein